MKIRTVMIRVFRCSLAVECAALLALGQPALRLNAVAYSATETQPDSNATIPPDQLDSLVAPIALYPDQLLAQVLAASTYPLELVQLQQWLAQHKDLKDKALADAVQKQSWDASVQGLAGLPDVVKFLTDDISWTTDLGNAFLAQQADVMDAVQRMRAKAQSKGNLKSSDQMKVESQTVESKQVIVIEQANPQVVYVPSYNPTVVYGAPPYPYPPIAYPPPGYYAAGMALSFGVGVAMGAMWSGGWGYNCGWRGGNNNIVINNNNNYVRNSNINNRSGNSINRGGNTWQHNPQHRGGTPYGNQATANRFGGTTAGSSRSQRQQNARQNIGQQRSNGQQIGGQNRQAGGGGQLSGQNRQTGAGGSGGTRGGGSAQSGGDRIGNRSVQSGGGQAKGGGGFGSGNFNGSSARASSSRGSSSMGGGARSGGGRTGGGRRR